MLDDGPQCVCRRGIKGQSPGHAQRQRSAHRGMIAMAVGFTHVMEQQGQIKHVRPLQTLKQRRIRIVRRVFRFPNAVQLLQTNQGVLIGGVLMIKLVLHQAGKLAELGKIFAKQVHFVHRAENRRDIATLVQDLQKSFPHMLVL